MFGSPLFVNPETRIPMAATLTVDTTGQIRTWSREAEELLGYSRLEAVGQSIEIIIPHHLRHRHGAGFGKFVQTGISTLPEVVTTIAVHKTGKLVKLPISVKALYGDDKKIMAVEATFHPSRDGT
jgi:PAS domain S-box-containing protein